MRYLIYENAPKLAKLYDLKENRCIMTGGLSSVHPLSDRVRCGQPESHNYHERIIIIM